MTLIVITSDVRLRAGPSTNAEIITVLSQHQRVEPTADHGWRHVMLEDGTQGWVAVDYLRPEAERDQRR